MVIAHAQAASEALGELEDAKEELGRERTARAAAEQRLAAAQEQLGDLEREADRLRGEAAARGSPAAGADDAEIQKLKVRPAHDLFHTLIV